MSSCMYSVWDLQENFVNCETLISKTVLFNDIFLKYNYV